jgi:hypothetical protein
LLDRLDKIIKRRQRDKDADWYAVKGIERKLNRYKWSRFNICVYFSFPAMRAHFICLSGLFIAFSIEENYVPVELVLMTGAGIIILSDPSKGWIPPRLVYNIVFVYAPSIFWGTPDNSKSI